MEQARNRGRQDTRSRTWDTPVMLAIVMVAAIAMAALPHVRGVGDDWRYGMPRTMHLSGVVGHADGPGRETRLVAMNLSRHVVVVEFPGGDVSTARVLDGPHLFGADADRWPVVIALDGIAGDDLPDLVVDVNGEQIIYVNDAGQFRLITDEERAQIERRTR